MKTYRQSMDQLHFTSEEKAAMVDRLMAGETKGVRKAHTFRRTLIVGVAAAALMTMGVGAAVALTPAGEMFASIFGSSPDQIEQINEIVTPIGVSDTNDGVTITADAIIGDTYSYAIVYSIQREDGVPLVEGLHAGETTGMLPLGFERADTDEGIKGGRHGWSYFFDADPTDHAVQFVEQVTFDNPIEPGMATATFQGLYQQCGSGFQNKKVLAEGGWELCFPLEFQDSGVDLTAGQNFQLNGMDATLDAVTISPLSMKVDYTVWEEPDWDAYYQEEINRYLDVMGISIHFMDGTAMDLGIGNGSIGQGKGKTYGQRWYLFDEILDLSTVESVSIGDITLPVAAE